MINVGYIHQGYPEKRNIIDVQHKDLKHVKCFDAFKVADYLHFRARNKTNLYYHNSFNDRLSMQEVEVFHLFNMVNFGKKNWVSTFETMLPRYEPSNPHIRKATEALSKDNCRKLIAMSSFNYQMQQRNLELHFPSLAKNIMAKTTVIFPPQKCHVWEAQKTIPETNLKVLFVGHDFFRKGGRELFNAIESLHQQGAAIELTIVSKLETDTFITQTTSSDKAEWKKKIAEASFCTYHESKANHEVLELMKQHHIFAVPSLQETFGYVVLEAQACATPVLTTSIRAFPEINNNDCGFVVDIPQNTNGVADVASLGYQAVSSILQDGIQQKLSEVVSNPILLEEKGRMAIERIKLHHSPESYAEKLMEIYQR